MQRIERDENGVAALQRRVAEVEEINRDLLAFARGHAGAVASIHEAVLALLAAENAEELTTIVTRDWPALLAVDAVAFVWSSEGRALAADRGGVRLLEPRLVQRMAGMERAITIRKVGRGHPLFGEDAPEIRTEVAVRIEGARGLGLVLLGQREGVAENAPAGARLLRFLGRSVATMLERWQPQPL